MGEGSVKQAGLFALNYELRIAFRYLFAKRSEGGLSAVAWYSLIGVTLSVATLIVIQAVMIGFRVEFVSKILGANSHLSVYSDSFIKEKRQGLNKELQEIISEKLKQVDSVINTMPIIMETVMASSTSGNAGVQVFGIQEEDLLKLPLLINPENTQGDIKKFSDGIAIGSSLARQLGVKVESNIRLVSPSGAKTVFGVTPRAMDFKVSYIFTVGRYDIDSTRIYMPISDAKNFFNRNNSVDRIDVLVDQPNIIESISDEINLNLMEVKGNKFVVWNWKQASNSFLSALDIERKAMFVIWSLVVLIAALNIISGLVMMVKNKTQDIAILRTIGFSRFSIMRIFFIAGSLIGVLGTILGVILGCLFSSYLHEIQNLVEFIFGGTVWDPQVRYLTKIPVKLRTSDILSATSIALVISLLITILPSYRAASLNPIEGLRHG